MAEITQRRKGELIRGVLALLLEHPDGLRAGEVVTRLKSLVPMTEYEAGEYDSGGLRFDKIVRFSTVGCVKAGWLLKEKGIWSLTEAGKAAYHAFSDPTDLYRQADLGYRAWDAARETPVSESEFADEVEIDDVAASITFEQAEEQAWAEIQQYVLRMEPYEFQDLVAGLLRAMGYHVAWVSPPGKDGGIDIMAWTDPLGTRPPRIKVQVKRYQSTVNVDGLRSFLAVLGEDDAGIFVATGGFTRDAQDLARSQERRKITLVDLGRLLELWVEFYKQLDDRARRLMPLQPIYFLAPRS